MSTTNLESGRLEALLESAKLLSGSLDLDSLLSHLLRSIMGRLLVSKGCVALENEDGLHVALSKGASALKPGTRFSEPAGREAGLKYFVSIGTEADSLGVLALGKPPSGQIHEDDLDFVRALLGIAAGGIANARAHEEAQRLNRNLDRKVHELGTLLDLVRGFTAVLEPEEVARLLGLTFAGQWAIRKYAVVAWRGDSEHVIREKGLTLSLEMLREGVRTVEAATQVESLPDGDLRAMLLSQDVRVIVPLRSADDAVVVVALGPRPGNAAYTEDDLEYATGLVSQAVVAFENSWLFRETLEKKKIEKELELAAVIQRRLLPASMPVIPGLEIVARTRPARHVGGDYFDAITISSSENSQSGPHLFCVADVSGKGIAASLLTSSVQATLRALMAEDLSLTRLVARTNDLIFATTDVNKYATAIFVLIDPVSGHCRFVNAGHNDGILLRADGSVELLKPGGTPVGLLASRTYTEGEFSLLPGDLIALYSDGVTEANDIDENEFELPRLVEILKQNSGQTTDAIVTAVYDAVDNFAASAPQYDDITLMVIRRV